MLAFFTTVAEAVVLVVGLIRFVDCYSAPDGFKYL
ncbi:hypothetical protein ShzoTeo12_52970 (plasmid) [Shinella zoogloeoides]|nr:hypothetical protein ShzoTeo12_52970 [Shinella zoogloeoides]